MNINRLENSSLIVEVCDIGAELNKLYSKKYNFDFLWNGDAKYWSRKSPVLFPIVGRLKDNEAIIDNKIYNISQHGFARDNEFKLTSKLEKSLTYSFKANMETKKNFPYDFQLNITFTLKEDALEVGWNVTNNDINDMYFSIGAHPAFNVPFNKGEELEDYYLSFETEKNIEEVILKAPYVKEKKKIDKLDRTPIIAEMFENDALIYSGVNKVSIHSESSDMTVGVEFKNFPFVGIWSPYYKDAKTIAPFICIEPWYGIADLENSNKVFKDKLGINKLASGQEFEASYKIVIE